MSKPVKNIIAEELARRYADCESACLVDLAGMDVAATQIVRTKLREKSAEMHVVKNSLARRAFKGTALEPLASALQGPCALVTSSESLIEVAKALVQMAEEFSALKLRESILDGEPTLYTVEQVSRMRTKNEVLGEVMMVITSPARAVAGCISSPQAKIAGCLKTVIDKAA